MKDTSVRPGSPAAGQPAPPLVVKILWRPMDKPQAQPQPPTAWTRDDLAHNPHFAPDKAARVQRMFTAIARRYDFNNRLHSLGRDQAWRRKVVALANVSPSDQVLDAACGTGDLSLLFAQAGAKRVVGVDFTPAMLEIARHKAEAISARDPDRRPGPPSEPRRGLSVRAGGLDAMEFTHADITQLPFEDASFDIVSIAFGLRNVERPERALREFRRVLRPATGRLLILEFSTPRNPFVRAMNRLYTRHIMPLTASLIARDRSGAYRYLPRSIETFPEGAGLDAAVREAGFTAVSQQPLTLGTCAITLAWCERPVGPISQSA